MANAKKLANIQQKLKFLKILKKLKPAEQEVIIGKLSEDGINELSEAVYNTLYCDMSMTKAARKRLRNKIFHFENDLRFIANKNKPWQSRQRKLQTQSGGAIVSTILGTVIPLVASLIANRLSSK